MQQKVISGIEIHQMLCSPLCGLERTIHKGLFSTSNYDFQMRIQSIQPPSHVYAKRGPVAINDPQDNASILYNNIWHLVHTLVRWSSLICTNQGSVVINYLVDNSTPQPIAISHSKLLAMQTLEQHKWKWKNQGEILFKLSDA